MNRNVILSIHGFALLSCSEKETPNSESINEEETPIHQLTAELDSTSKAKGFNGFAVAIADEKGTLYARGFGYSIVGTNEKYTENTTQQIASVSKTSIGLVLMKTQKMGKLKWDDSIQNYLPFQVISPFRPSAEITI